MNYFDSDVSLESKNAILLTGAPETPGQSYAFDDNGVKQDFTCIPQSPPPFEYSGSKMFGVDGKPE